jgi:glycine cleavage system H protein
VGDYSVADDLRYTKEHEWVRVEGGLAVVGISDFAAKQLGDVTYVELPPLGKRVTQMGEMCVVESVKAAADVYAPLAGAVAEVNTALEDAPQLINSEPYGAGWLVKLKDFAQAEVDELMDAGQYRSFIAEA